MALRPGLPPSLQNDMPDIQPSPSAGQEDTEALTERLRSLLEQRGVHVRQQAALVAELCGLSVSQARRKLQGASWLFHEVAALARHCQVSLDEVCAPPEAGSAARRAPPENGLALLEGAELECEVVIGHLLSPRDQQVFALQALRDGHRWLVAAPNALQRLRPQAPRYAVERLQIVPPRGRAGLRVAIVDDDALAAGALGEWFNDAGSQAHEFATSAALLATDLARFDAFVVDFILGPGQNAEGLITHLRQRRPTAPIALLTGRLRDGTASEDALTALMRSLNVMFFEKPVRPGVLLAALLNSLERPAGVGHHG